MKFDARGREIPDSTPMALPPHAHHPEPLAQTIQRMVREQLSRYAAEDGLESLDEASDFDLDDEDEWENQPTQYTLREEEGYEQVWDTSAETAVQRAGGDDSPGGLDESDHRDVSGERESSGDRESEGSSRAPQRPRAPQQGDAENPTPQGHAPARARAQVKPTQR